MQKTKNTLCESPLRSLNYDLFSVLENDQELTTLSRPLHSKLKKSQGLSKDFHRNLRTFQGKRNSRTLKDCANPDIH